MNSSKLRKLCLDFNTLHRLLDPFFMLIFFHKPKELLYSLDHPLANVPLLINHVIFVYVLCLLSQDKAILTSMPFLFQWLYYQETPSFRLNDRGRSISCLICKAIHFVRIPLCFHSEVLSKCSVGCGSSMNGVISQFYFVLRYQSLIFVLTSFIKVKREKWNPIYLKNCPWMLSSRIKEFIPEFSGLCPCFTYRTRLQPTVFSGKTLGLVSKRHLPTLEAFLSPSGFL